MNYSTLFGFIFFTVNKYFAFVETVNYTTVHPHFRCVFFVFKPVKRSMIIYLAVFFNPLGDPMTFCVYKRVFCTKQGGN